MQRMWHGLLLVTVMGCAAVNARPVVGAPETNGPEGAANAPKVAEPEIRPSSPEDEALKELLQKRGPRKSISLSSGPWPHPHKVLGPVEVIAASPSGETALKPGPNLYLNELLRSKAIELYGEDGVDAIVSISYAPADTGKIKATGTAVHFDGH